MSERMRCEAGGPDGKRRAIATDAHVVSRNTEITPSARLANSLSRAPAERCSFGSEGGLLMQRLPAVALHGSASRCLEGGIKAATQGVP